MADYPGPVTYARPAFSAPSIIAIICALVSFYAGAFWGMLLALAAIFLGLIGMALALAPGVRGGVVSVISILAGALGIVAALFKLVF